MIIFWWRPRESLYRKIVAEQYTAWSFNWTLFETDNFWVEQSCAEIRTNQTLTKSHVIFVSQP